MVPPNYARKSRAIASSIGLGQKRTGKATKSIAAILAEAEISLEL